jgi:hypothetical protein
MLAASIAARHLKRFHKLDRLERMKPGGMAKTHQPARLT